jgi:type IV secretion system protein VirB10
MKFLRRLKKNQEPASLATDADIEAGLAEAADRELPSVNARKKGNKLTGLAALVFIAGMGLFLIYQMNTGTDRKQKAAAKKEVEVAKSNAVSGTLPPISVPAKPPAPIVDDKQAGVAQTGSTDQVPAPAGSSLTVPSKPEDPAIALAAAGSNANGQAAKAGTPTARSALELARERRRLGPLAVKLDNDDRGNPMAAGTDQVEAMQAEVLKGGLGATGGITAGTDNSPAGSRDDLKGRLQPTITKATLAARLPNRTFLVPKGAFMDCALETRLDSTLPGMTSCILTRNVYSDNGKLVLLDRGSKIVGEYQGGMKQGQARIFVLWTRIETPAGVVINLDSPGTDSLGATGMDGHVDTHFGARFGGAMMLSLLDDAMAAATQNSSSGTNVMLNTQSAAQSMAAEALRNTINIPPTLIKNQGDHINIFVARDLDFRSVYDIRAK